MMLTQIQSPPPQQTEIDDTPTICDNCRANFDCMPSYPPSARPTVHQDDHLNAELNEPTRLAEPAPFRARNATMSKEQFKESLFVKISRRKLRNLEKEALIGRRLLE